MARSTKKKREKNARVDRMVRKVIIVVKMNQPYLFYLISYVFVDAWGWEGDKVHAPIT